MINSRKPMGSTDIIGKLLYFIKPLIEGIAGDVEDSYEFEENQNQVAKIPHIVDCKDISSQFQSIMAIKASFVKGGATRMKYTIPSVVWALYRLSQKHFSEDFSESSAPGEQAKFSITQIFDCAYQTIESITATCAENSLYLLMNGISAMNLLGSQEKEIEELAVKYAKQIFSLYRTEIADSDTKYKALTLLIGTLNSSSLFSAENYAYLCQEINQFSSKLLKKQDQCRAIMQCTHMYCKEKSVNEFLKE